jgi:parallel beta-helix repeat protein
VKNCLAAVFSAVVMFAWAASAAAVDGTIEINLAKVLANGGFPYVITTSGSYRLTGNLTVSSTSADAIDVNANDVTIDLNGFSIIGPGGSTSGNGISAASVVDVTVQNGTITGFGGSAAIRAGKNSIVRNVHAGSNGNGIVAGSGSVISDNIAHDNSSTGINCNGSGCAISGNTALDNTQGISANDATTGYEGNVLKNATNVSGGTSMKNNVCAGSAC